MVRGNVRVWTANNFVVPKPIVFVGPKLASDMQPSLGVEDVVNDAFEVVPAHIQSHTHNIFLIVQEDNIYLSQEQLQ